MRTHGSIVVTLLPGIVPFAVKFQFIVLFRWRTNAFPFGAALLRAALWQKERSISVCSGLRKTNLLRQVKFSQGTANGTGDHEVVDEVVR